MTPDTSDIARHAAGAAGEDEMSDITAAGPRLQAMNDALERDRLLLTGAEREAIVTALAFLREEADEPAVAQEAATLRGLLERTK